MGSMWLTVTKSLFVVSSKYVTYISLVASMVIPSRVDNYKCGKL